MTYFARRGCAYDPEDLKRHQEAAAQVDLERRKLYPAVTPENFDEVNAWREARLLELTQKRRST